MYPEQTGQSADWPVCLIHPVFLCCPKGDFWKISLPATGGTPALASALSATSPSLTFADLKGGAVGQTIGTGKDTQINENQGQAFSPGHGSDRTVLNVAPLHLADVSWKFCY